jgi:DNA-binding NtrC family response regulator
MLLVTGKRMDQSAAPSTVFVIDDDREVRVSIAELLKGVGLRAETFNAAPEFLARKRKRLLRWLDSTSLEVPEDARSALVPM